MDPDESRAEEPMMTEADDVTPGELRRWLQRVDRKVDELDRDMRANFAGLSYVPVREYERDRENADKYAAETRAIAASARAWVWAMFAVVSAAVLAAGYALVRSV